MPNIAALLKSEISRISRREIRQQVAPVRKASAAYRREIAALKRQVQDLQRRAVSLAKRTEQVGETTNAAAPEKPMRFVAKGLRSLRKRLGLSAPDLARLMGVSDQSVYNWELKRATPRKEQLATLATIRSLGKREARRRLEELQGQQSTARAGRSVRKKRAQRKKRAA